MAGAAIVLSASLAGPAAAAVSCRITADDRLAVRDVSSALATAKPSFDRFFSGDGSAASLRRAVSGATLMATTSRVSQSRADNAELQRIFRLYASGWVNTARGFQAAAGGDEDQALDLIGRGQATYRQGQDVFRRFIKVCKLRAGSLG